MLTHRHAFNLILIIVRSNTLFSLVALAANGVAAVVNVFVIDKSGQVIQNINPATCFSFITDNSSFKVTF